MQNFERDYWLSNLELRLREIGWLNFCIACWSLCTFVVNIYFAGRLLACCSIAWHGGFYLMYISSPWIINFVELYFTGEVFTVIWPQRRRLIECLVPGSGIVHPCHDIVQRGVHVSCLDQCGRWGALSSERWCGTGDPRKPRHDSGAWSFGKFFAGIRLTQPTSQQERQHQKLCSPHV